MPRIYINYSQSEYELISSKSKEMGLPPSTFAKYKSLLGLSSQNTYDLVEIMNKMYSNLNKMNSGTTFIVSSLVSEEWVHLTRGQKMTLSKKLSSYVDDNPDIYERIGKLPDKTTQYKKIAM